MRVEKSRLDRYEQNFLIWTVSLKGTQIKYQNSRPFQTICSLTVLEGPDAHHAAQMALDAPVERLYAHLVPRVLAQAAQHVRVGAAAAHRLDGVVVVAPARAGARRRAALRVGHHAVLHVEALDVALSLADLRTAPAIQARDHVGPCRKGARYAT